MSGTSCETRKVFWNGQELKYCGVSISDVFSRSMGRGLARVPSQCIFASG